MTTVLDSGGLSMLAGNRARLAELRRRGEWPAVVPAIVLTEALTGDHRRDFHTERLLKACDLQPVDEHRARHAAQLRTAVMPSGTVSAVDAVVAAEADRAGGATVLTSDPADLKALANHTTNPLRVVPV